MASITLSGSGSLGARNGHVLGWINDLLSIQGGTATTNVASGSQPATRYAQVMGDLAAGTADYADGDGLNGAVTSFQSGALSLVDDLKSRFRSILVTMAEASQSLTEQTVEYAMELLVQQMTIDSSSIAKCTPAVAAQTAVGTPVGNPTWTLSLVDAAGRTQNFVFPELLSVFITTDSQEGATAGNEAWQMRGKPKHSNPMAWDWLTSPYGSGADLSGNLLNGGVDWSGGASNADAPSQNFLVNGDFRVYSNAGIPDNFSITVGTANSTILNSSGSQNYLTGGGSVELKSNGSALLGIKQQFSTTSTTGSGTGGTPAILVTGAANNAVYLASVHYKLTAGSPSAGVLRLSIVDSGNTIVQNDAGTNLSATTDLTAVADTNWHQATLAFSLPKALPTLPAFRIDQSTAVDNTNYVYLANAHVQLMQPLYNGGPYVGSSSGSTNPNSSGIAPDNWTFTVTNTTSKWLKGFWRIIDPANLSPAGGAGSPYATPGNGYVMPALASGSATMADTQVA